MSRLVLSVSMVVIVLASCATTQAPSSTASVQPTATGDPTPVASPPPSEATSPSSPPQETAVPTASPPPLSFTADEQYLVDGIRRGAIDCQPVRDDLPTDAIAGIECQSDEPSVARIGFYRFADDEAMLAAYFARMEVEGIEQESGGCIDGEGEGSYIPYEGGVSPDRDGCFVNAEGYANYRATISGNHVYIGILGRSDDLRALDDFAWLGNQDTPGNPTLWADPGA